MLEKPGQMTSRNTLLLARTKTLLSHGAVREFFFYTLSSMIEDKLFTMKGFSMKQEKFESAESVFRTFNLTKRYGDFLAVDGVNLNVRAGQVYGFLGPNGAGKTTTIGMLLGLLHPTSGRVEIFGENVDPFHTTPLRRVGSLVGAPGMLPHLTGRENLKLLGRLNGINSQRVEEVLKQVDMVKAADRNYRGYSTGMKQRLGLAAALLHEPELLILDEPTNGLDPAGMREIRDFLRDFAAQGVTVFLSSHLLHEVEQVCDRIAVLKQGRIVAEGPVSQLLGDQKVVKVWVSSPKEAALSLQSLSGITRIEPNGSCVQVEGVTSQAVIKHLVLQGIVPSEVTFRKADLEQIFLELTE